MAILVTPPIPISLSPSLLSEHSNPNTLTPAVDVNIYASKPQHAHPLVGNHENTEIGVFLRDYLNVDTDAVTKELKEQLASSSRFENWLRKPVDEAMAMGELDHYEGDFKRKRSVECGCGAVH